MPNACAKQFAAIKKSMDRLEQKIDAYAKDMSMPGLAGIAEIEVRELRRLIEALEASLAKQTAKK
jgi:hypothetical protein